MHHGATYTQPLLPVWACVAMNSDQRGIKILKYKEVSEVMIVI